MFSYGGGGAGVRRLPTDTHICKHVCIHTRAHEQTTVPYIRVPHILFT